MQGCHRYRNTTPVAVGVLASLFAMISSSASAAEFTRSIIIQSVAGVSTERPASAQAQSVVRIFANAAAPWGSSSCRTDAADISMEDWHIFSLAMRAWKEAMSVSVVVESSVRIDTGDTVCKVVAIHATP